MSEAPAPTWAIVELMGHRQRAGLCQQVEQFGAVMLRIDLPTDDGTEVTEFYGGSSIYAFRPCTEAVARAFAKECVDPRPVSPVNFRPVNPQLPFGRGRADEFEDDEDEGPY